MELLTDTPTDDTVFLQVQGELDLDCQDDFEKALCCHLDSSSVVVDLSRLEFLSIASLRSLLVGRRSATAANRELAYVGAPAQARRLVTVAGLQEEVGLSATGSRSERSSTRSSASVL